MIAPATLCVSVGHANVRFAHASEPDEARTERAVLWRDRLTGRPLAVGHMPSCRTVWRFRGRLFPLATWPAEDDVRLVSAVLVGARSGVRREGRPTPRRLFVAMSAGLDDRLGPALGPAARGAGFRIVEMRSEEGCLAAAFAGDAPSLVVDVGDEETRLLARPEGAPGPVPLGVVATGGRAMRDAVLSALRSRGMLVAEAHAERLATDDPGVPWPRQAKCRALATARPARIPVERAEVAGALRPVQRALAAGVRALADRVPVAPGARLRVVVVGAAATTLDLARVLGEDRPFDVSIAAAPHAAVLRGLALLSSGAPTRAPARAEAPHAVRGA